MSWKSILSAVLALVFLPAVFAEDALDRTNLPPCDALKNTTILLIRHAEKPDDGTGLAPAGEARAQAYVDYFQHFQIAGQPLKLDRIFCAADSKKSQRPRLTITPLSQALKLTPDNRFANKDAAKLAVELRAQAHGRQLLICWHHGEMPGLLAGLGANPEQLLPNGKWPEDVFGWLIELRYNEKGCLQESRLLKENLMPDDQATPSTHEK